MITLRRSPGLSLGLIHNTSRGFGRYRGIDEQAFERVIQIPVIDDVLVIPDDLAGVGIQRQRGVVIEVLLVVAAQHETSAPVIVTDVPM